MTEETKKVPCEIFTRCCGYFRPITNMNPGVKEQVKERKTINMEKAVEDARKS